MSETLYSKAYRVHLNPPPRTVVVYLFPAADGTVLLTYALGDKPGLVWERYRDWAGVFYVWASVIETAAAIHVIDGYDLLHVGDDERRPAPCPAL